MLDLAPVFEKWRNETLIPTLKNNPQWITTYAHGNAERFIEGNQSYLATHDRFTQFGLHYSTFLDKGRGPMNEAIPAPNRFELMKAWVGLKKYGITFKTEKEQEGIAWAIMKTHDKLGSYKFRMPNKQTEIYEDVLRQTLPILQEQLAGVAITQINTDVAAFIKATVDSKKP
jgi:hypothetical protein